MTLPGAPDQAELLVATWVNLLPLPEVAWEVQPVEMVGAVGFRQVSWPPSLRLWLLPSVQLQVGPSQIFGGSLYGIFIQGGLRIT